MTAAINDIYIDETRNQNSLKLRSCHAGRGGRERGGESAREREQSRAEQYSHACLSHKS